MRAIHITATARRSLEFIRRYPRLFPRYADGVRRAMVSPQIAMFYLENEDTIRVILFWDMRQDPEKLRL